MDPASHGSPLHQIRVRRDYQSSKIGRVAAAGLSEFLSGSVKPERESIVSCTIVQAKRILVESGRRRRGK